LISAVVLICGLINLLSHSVSAAYHSCCCSSSWNTVHEWIVREDC